MPRSGYPSCTLKSDGRMLKEIAKKQTDNDISNLKLPLATINVKLHAYTVIDCTNILFMRGVQRLPLVSIKKNTKAC